MTRLCVLYHDDTLEPVAVEAIGLPECQHGWVYAVQASAKFAVGEPRDVFEWGDMGRKCRELLLRERAAWVATREVL